MTSKEDIDHRFSYHQCDERGLNKMRMVRKRVRELAHSINLYCPDGREKSTALTQLSFVMQCANAAIAFQFPIDENELKLCNPMWAETMRTQSEMDKSQDEGC